MEKVVMQVCKGIINWAKALSLLRFPSLLYPETLDFTVAERSKAGTQKQGTARM